MRDQPILDEETASRLSEQLSEMQNALADHGALLVGSTERIEKYEELAKLSDEINSYFRSAVH